MAEYIDRHEAVVVVSRPALTRAELRRFICQIPAADVKPVVHGRWIEYPDCLKYPNAYADDHIVCSVCEECFSVLDNDTARFWFCPHCGADMRATINYKTGG